MILGIVIMFGVTGCVAPWRAYRDASQQTVVSAAPGNCQKKYDDTDEEIGKIAEDFQKSNKYRNQWLSEESKKIDPKDNCWKSAYEHHRQYDVFYAEFDDEGNATDVTQADGAKYSESELYLIKQKLSAMVKDQPLNVVVFTHGWHGSASARDSYSIEFKGMLLDIANGDAKKASERTAESSARIKTKRDPNDANPSGGYRTVGIEVAWRGDSLDTPGLKYLNVWDRKLAADTISKGAVHDLFAFLNGFYLEHSCHGSRAQPGCGQVHMLSVAHSFGALIDFQAFVGRLESGLAVDGCDRAYGFGDMTILLNPAFEGTRYRPYFNTAMDRSNYLGDPASPGCSNEAWGTKEVQVPTVVVLQSKGDWATEWTFPFLRWFSARAARTLSKEESVEQIQAVGWVEKFRTHSLTLTEDTEAVDSCLPTEATTLIGAPKSYCPFSDPMAEKGMKSSNRTQGLVLSFDPSGLEDKPPSYMPAWSVAVDKCIMQDHDDFWNPQIVRLIRILFEDAYEQSERLHGERTARVTQQGASGGRNDANSMVAVPTSGERVGAGQAASAQVSCTPGKAIR